MSASPPQAPSGISRSTASSLKPHAAVKRPGPPENEDAGTRDAKRQKEEPSMGKKKSTVEETCNTNNDNNNNSCTCSNNNTTTNNNNNNSFNTNEHVSELQESQNLSSNYQMLQPTSVSAEFSRTFIISLIGIAMALLAGLGVFVWNEFRGQSPGGPRMSQSMVGPMGGQPRKPMISRPGIPPQAKGQIQRQQKVQAPNFKYTPNVRNLSQVVDKPQGLMPQQIPQATELIHGQEPLTASMLAAAQPQEQKQMLGERLFPLVHQMNPDLDSKITGMLLERDNSELVHMLEHQESLKDKVEEAVAVLQTHQGKNE